jgi:hypothetical protein
MLVTILKEPELQSGRCERLLRYRINSLYKLFSLFSAIWRNLQFLHLLLGYLVYRACSWTGLLVAQHVSNYDKRFNDWFSWGADWFTFSVIYCSLHIWISNGSKKPSSGHSINDQIINNIHANSCDYTFQNKIIILWQLNPLRTEMSLPR